MNLIDNCRLCEVTMRLHKIATARENDLRQEILNLRLKAFKKRRLDVEQVSNKLFDANNKLEDFKQLGLVDEVATVDEIIAKEFDGVKRSILNINSTFGVAGRLETPFN